MKALNLLTPTKKIAVVVANHLESNEIKKNSLVSWQRSEPRQS